MRQRRLFAGPIAPVFGRSKQPGKGTINPDMTARGCRITNYSPAAIPSPASFFDLSHWKISKASVPLVNESRNTFLNLVPGLPL